MEDAKLVLLEQNLLDFLLVLLLVLLHHLSLLLLESGELTLGF